MPVYEFYCAECHAIFNFLSRRVSRTKPHLARAAIGRDWKRKSLRLPSPGISTNLPKACRTSMNKDGAGGDDPRW